jgi:hypothetical protein
MENNRRSRYICSFLVLICSIIFCFDSIAYCQTQPREDKSAVIITSTKTFDWNDGPQAWKGTNDFSLDSTFTKLTGPLDGNAWITESPYNRETYTEGAYASSQGYKSTYPGPNLLISPWLDISGIKGNTLYVSFSHSIATEPDWDRSWMEYTTDDTTWYHLGKLNDPKGVNWYSESVYEFAHSDDASGNIDEATLKQYGLIPDANGLPIDTWTSNGTELPTGPWGWIAVKLRIDAGDYIPEIVHSKRIKFRYVSFSDAATAVPNGGWAVDNFTIGGK